MNNSDDSDRRRQRLAWRCRRGMQELDIMLTRFLDQQFAQLDEPGRQQFERLLEQEDDLLWDWLSGRVACPDPDLAVLIASMRA